jgi:hypothetical protein
VGGGQRKCTKSKKGRRKKYGIKMRKEYFAVDLQRALSIKHSHKFKIKSSVFENL